MSPSGLSDGAANCFREGPESNHVKTARSPPVDVAKVNPALVGGHKFHSGIR